MRNSNSVFDYVHLLYYKCHKINPNGFVSYIDFRDWIKTSKLTINHSLGKTTNISNTLQKSH